MFILCIGAHNCGVLEHTFLCFGAHIASKPAHKVGLHVPPHNASEQAACTDYFKISLRSVAHGRWCMQ